MTSKYNLAKLSPTVRAFAEFLAEACSNDTTRPTLTECAEMGGWTKNATAWRISHLRSAGLTDFNGESIKLCREQDKDDREQDEQDDEQQEVA